MSFQILACGSNGSYQLGLGNNDDHNTLQYVPGLKSFADVKPKTLAFGGNHTFILYPEGQLFTTGNNEHGQCGVESPDTLRTFTAVPGKWKSVAAGWEYSILWSYDNQVYSCGHGPKGELGLGEGRTHAKRLEKIELPENTEISEIKCSVSHCVVKLQNGRWMGWGAARQGQLGPQKPVLTSSGKIKPRPAIWRPEILAFDVAHSFALGRDSTILTGPRIRVYGVGESVLDINTDNVKAMWSSIHYTAFSPNSGSHERSLIIQSLGNDSHGQCFKYETPGPVKAFEVGSEHGLALLANNSVYAWGWGEHGNCGAMKDQNVTFDYLNRIYDGTAEVVILAGGLATTWLVVKRK